MEYWECQVCKALTLVPWAQCWQCQSTCGTSDLSETSATQRAAMRRFLRDRNQSASPLLNTQFGLILASSALAIWALLPLYCHLFSSRNCSYQGGFKLLFVLAVPFILVAIDLYVIFRVAPFRVPRHIAETYLHNGKPAFLRRWYSRLLVQSYNKQDA